MKGNRVLVVEDEPLFASHVEMLLAMMELEVIDTVVDSKTALHIAENHALDLVLMDIHINGDFDGIETAERLKDRHNIPVIFMTSNEDDLTFNRAARSKPVAFLVKPFTDLQLKRTLELVLGNTKKDDQNSAEVNIVDNNTSVLFIKKQNKIHKVDLDIIYYLEADGRYTRVYTKNEYYLVRKSLKDMQDLMPENIFVRSHRSYVVNMNKVKSVDLEEDVLILEERTVPLSKREKDKLLERLKWI